MNESYGEQLLKAAWLAWHENEPPSDEFEDWFVLDESLPGMVVQYASNFTRDEIDAALDYWRWCTVQILDDTVQQLKAEAYQAKEKSPTVKSG
jgi:hypothetical protein